MMDTTPDIAAVDDRSTAQFFFEVGYSAAWADAYMANGKKAAFPISDESLERAWAIAPEAHADPEEWDRHMAATQQPPRQLTRGSSGCTLEPLAGAQSDEAIRHLQIRSPLNRAIYKALHDHRLSNMGDEEGYPYPLLDLMSNPAPSDIGTGEFAMIGLSDEICEAVEAVSPWLPIETAPKDGTAVLGMLTGSQLPHTIRHLDGKWLIAWDEYDLSDQFDKPTHWMPLPASPSQIGEGE